MKTRKLFLRISNKMKVLDWKHFKDTHREKAPSKIKLQRFRKLWIWTFGRLVHQINSLYEVLKLKQNFRKNKVVAGKTSFFLIGPFCAPDSIFFNIGFWHSSFVWECWKCSAFILSTLNLKTVLQFCEKGFRFSENLLQSWSIEIVQNFLWLSHKNMSISQTEGYFKNP